MDLLVKIENAINFLLIKLTELMLKAMPKSVRTFFRNVNHCWVQFLVHFKSLPELAKKWLLLFIQKTKSYIASVSFKEALKETYQTAITQYKTRKASQVGKLKTFFLTPFLIMGQWLQGLSASQSMLLLTFSAASFLAVVGIGFSSKKMLNTGEAQRAPASAEEILYERPDYYKKSSRHLEITNLRLPVYIPEVNEIRSVDIDFTATLSNRYSRAYLEKHEFHLRDHLILQIEPSVASFPLLEEGKQIIRHKLLMEINDFLKMNKIDGEVTDLKITYILAN
ncbi:MAG: hypothetical protein NDI69_12825 [Bacteriovoracaceae bacterium]|nr:hypothetical protein [Bacteriovoracaceae bacterium]